MITILNRKQRVSAHIALVIALAVFLYAGVLTGLHRDWFNMGFFFLLVVFDVYCYVGFLLNTKLDISFKRLEDIVYREPDSIPLGNRLIRGTIIIFTAISNVVTLSLSIISGLRQHWLALCVFLAGFMIINYISVGLILALKIKAYSEYLEGLICGQRNAAPSQERSAE